MHPILFQIGPLTVYSFGVMLAVAVVVCGFLLSRDAGKAGISTENVYDLVFWIVLGGIIGARIFYICIAWDNFSGNWLQMLMINNGGVAWQGGFVGGTLAGLWFVKIRKLPLRPLMDLCAPYVALGQAIGRIGCFLNGCCFGKECEFGLYFPNHHARLIPTQLYEAASLFLIYVILKIYAKRLHSTEGTFHGGAGMVFVLYLWLAAIERFVIEFFRADQAVVWRGLSPFQYIAIGVFIAGIVVFMKVRK